MPPRKTAVPTGTIAQLLTTVALARLFRVSRVSINKWRNRGCPCVLIPGDARDTPRYVLSDVVAWRDRVGGLPVPGWVRSRLSRLTGMALPAPAAARRRRPRPRA